MVITDNSKFFKSKGIPFYFNQLIPVWPIYALSILRLFFKRQTFEEFTIVYAFSWPLYVRIASFSFIPHGSISPHDPHSLHLVLLWLIRVLLLWYLQIDKIFQCVCGVGNAGCKTEWRNVGLVWASPNPGSSSSWLHGCSRISFAKEEDEARLPLRTTNV